MRVAGRILLLRRQGKLTFATMRDQSGAVQLFVSDARARRGRRTTQFDQLDLGDWVGVDGTVMTTRKGELSVKVDARSSCWPRRCARCPTSGTASPTSTPASASATST